MGPPSYTLRAFRLSQARSQVNRHTRGGSSVALALGWKFVSSKCRRNARRIRSNDAVNVSRVHTYNLTSTLPYSRSRGDARDALPYFVKYKIPPE